MVPEPIKKEWLKLQIETKIKNGSNTQRSSLYAVKTEETPEKKKTNYRYSQQHNLFKWIVDSDFR